MKLKQFNSRDELDEQLAAQIASNLHDSIFKHGSANMLVSGGTSPIQLYEKLSHFPIQWNLVTVALVDERFVPTDHEASNELLVKKHLLKNFASRAQFIGMVYDAKNEENNLKIAKTQFQPFFQEPISVAILGMGEDGHTASLFPGDAGSEADLKRSDQPDLISSKSPKSPIERISCNKKAILESEHIYVLIHGTKKLNVIQNDSSESLPISHFKNEQHVHIYYTE